MTPDPEPEPMMVTINVRSNANFTKFEFGTYSTEEVTIVGGTYTATLSVPSTTTGIIRYTMASSSSASSVNTLRWYPTSGTISTIAFSRQTVGTTNYILTESTSIPDGVTSMTAHLLYV